MIDPQFTPPAAGSNGEPHDVENNGQSGPKLRPFPREVPNQGEVSHSETVAGPRPIDFGRFKKLKEPLVAERIVEVVAHLRGEEGSVVLRLEALRSPDQTGCQPRYEIAVYRRTTVSVGSPYQTRRQSSPAKSAVEAARSPLTAVQPLKQDIRVWAAYDLISSDRPTADWALEQALGFLEARCE
jgi:hypothetical protein